MFYVPIRLFETAQLKTPKGPKLGRVSRTSIDIAGTEFSVRVPKHRPKYRNHKAIHPQRYYASENLPLQSYYNEQHAAKGRKDLWLSGSLLYRTWAFYGPWFTGVLSELRLEISLVRPVNYAQRFSLFHPRALEQIIGDYLDDYYGRRLSFDGKPMYAAPVNWQPLQSQSPVNVVRFEVVPQLRSTPSRTTEHYFFSPIADDLMVICRFEPSRFLALPVEEIDKLVDLQPMLDLMNEIIDSIQIKLSPEAQEQQAKALEGLVDTSLVKEFPPLKWGKFDEGSKTENLTKL